MWATRYSTIVVAAVLGLALVVCAWVVTRGIIRVKTSGDIIRITGSARKIIRSDFIIWHARISARADKMDTAYGTLREGVEKTRAYLLKNGITAAEITVAPTQTESLYAPRPANQYGYDANAYREILGYRLSQEIVVKSEQVEQVDKVARSATDLLSAGVELESLPPEYLYTKLGELKVTMLAEAAKDARSRADQIAINSGSRVGSVRFARMGVMRIIPAYTTSELNAEGTYDTSTLDKEIVAIVTAGYSIR